MRNNFWQAPSPQNHWVLQVGTQERRPSGAVFIEVKSINNMHSAPPVVSTRSRCVQQSLCVCIHVRAHALVAAGAGCCEAQTFFQAGCSQYRQIQEWVLSCLQWLGTFLPSVIALGSSQEGCWSQWNVVQSLLCCQMGASPLLSMLHRTEVLCKKIIEEGGKKKNSM